ncbi:hypothetical protein Golax_021865, partial [Gossypium laxum]|nr:hypothetical protein [Gossypium laxum]
KELTLLTLLTWLYIDKQEEERNYLALHVDILFEIALLC